VVGLSTSNFSFAISSMRYVMAASCLSMWNFWPKNQLSSLLRSLFSCLEVSSGNSLSECSSPSYVTAAVVGLGLVACLHRSHHWMSYDAAARYRRAKLTTWSSFSTRATSKQLVIFSLLVGWLSCSMFDLIGLQGGIGCNSNDVSEFTSYEWSFVKFQN